LFAAPALAGIFQLRKLQPRAVFNWMCGKERFGTVPGAVATGSLAPGRYRSRYRTAPQLWRSNESPGIAYSFAIRS